MACSGVKYRLRPTSFRTSALSRPAERMSLPGEAELCRICSRGAICFTRCEVQMAQSVLDKCAVSRAPAST